MIQPPRQAPLGKLTKAERKELLANGVQEFARRHGVPSRGIPSLSNTYLLLTKRQEARMSKAEERQIAKQNKASTAVPKPEPFNQSYTSNTDNNCATCTIQVAQLLHELFNLAKTVLDLCAECKRRTWH